MATATLAPAETIGDLLAHLGGIEPSRVRMKPLPGMATEHDVIAFNEAKTTLCELVDGTLVEKAMGVIESMLAGSILALLRSFVLTHNLGFVLGPDGMIRLAPGSVRLPDVAFLSWARTADGRIPDVALSAFAPDLAVEVLSPSNTRAEMARKRSEYFAAGVRLLWEVDPRSRTVAVYESPDRCTRFDATMTLDGGDILPGFELHLADLFGELDRQGNQAHPSCFEARPVPTTFPFPNSLAADKLF